MNVIVSTATPSDCLKLLQDYIPEEFKSLTEEEIDVCVQNGGLVNTLKLVTRKRDNYKVIIREYGGNVFDGPKLRSFLPPMSYQLLIFYELSKRGIGPKLLGVFEGGRIEEFIPSHTLTPKEFENEEILRDIAINTAIIHSMKLPFSQSPMNRFDMMSQRYKEFRKETDLEKFCQRFKDGITDCGADYNLFQKIVNIDWSKEAENLKKVINTFEQRIGLILWDANFLNVLVRNNPSSGQLKVCLIDYEFCRYDNLVNDIACRFLNQLINFAGKGSDKATGYKILDEQKRRIFIREYLRETKKQKIRNSENLNGTEINGHAHEEAKENSEVDQWMKECDHYIAAMCIHFTLMTFTTDFFLAKDVNWVVSILIEMILQSPNHSSCTVHLTDYVHKLHGVENVFENKAWYNFLTGTFSFLSLSLSMI